MRDLQPPPLDDATSAAIAEITTRAPSKLARRIQRFGLAIGAAAAGGLVAMKIGWVGAQWEMTLRVTIAVAAITLLAVDQFYLVKWKFVARQLPWTSLAIGACVLYAGVMPLVGARLGLPVLGVLCGLLGIGLFADEWRSAHRGPRSRSGLFGTGVLSLGVLTIGALMSVGNDLPNRVWRILFLWAVAFLAVGCVLFFRERARPVPPPLWERRPK